LGNELLPKILNFAYLAPLIFQHIHDNRHLLMILIHTEQQTNRVRYIFHLFFHDLFGTEYLLTSDSGHFLTWSGPKFSYGIQPLEDELFIRAVPLLFEKGTDSPVPECVEISGSKVLFPIQDQNSAFPFDLFAASFYLVTRYEEYETVYKDQHGRFNPLHSIAFKENFLDKPVVNIWALKLKDILLIHFPNLVFSARSFRFLPTIDIDSAYAYRHKGFWRTAGGFLRSLSRGDLSEMKERCHVIQGGLSDPFDTYGYLSILHKKFDLSPYFFILLGDYGPYDKNLSPRNKHFRELVARLAAEHTIGIHPSYASHDHPARLKSEILRLASIINRKVTISREHFLRITMPYTFRNLISSGIECDFTMGYAQEPGFRASICTPYLFYDLYDDKSTSLRIYPFTVMDGTLRDYKNLSPEQASEVINVLIGEIKAVNGIFISIWHNETLGDQKRWKGWRTVYEKMILHALDS